MIQTVVEKVKEKYSTIVTKEKERVIEKYICSDGKVFTNKNDNVKEYYTGKFLAEKHEDRLIKEIKLKENIKFHLIEDNRLQNLNYYRSFYFIMIMIIQMKLKILFLI